MLEAPEIILFVNLLLLVFTAHSLMKALNMIRKSKRMADQAQEILNSIKQKELENGDT